MIKWWRKYEEDERPKVKWCHGGMKRKFNGCGVGKKQKRHKLTRKPSKFLYYIKKKENYISKYNFHRNPLNVFNMSFKKNGRCRGEEEFAKKEKNNC